MKIVNPSPQDSESQHSNELLHLDHEINLLQAKFQKCLQSDISGAPEEDVFARALKRAERENKLAIIAVLENSIEEIESVLDYVDCLTGPTVPANFPLFGELPIELRLKIWDHTFLDDYQQERIHYINVSLEAEYYLSNGLIDPSLDPPIQFISSQPVHPILQVCQESRNHYITRTQSDWSPDIATYINFNTDIIYLPESSYADRIIEQFLFGTNVSRCPIQVQRLAMPKSIYCDLLQDIANEDLHHSKIHWKMRMILRKLTQVLIVFDTYEMDSHDREGLYDKMRMTPERRVMDLTARQKRIGLFAGEVAYVRSYIKYLSPESKKMKYRFVFIFDQ